MTAPERYPRALDGRPVAEIPTIWLERAQGTSNFKIARWIPHALRWYRFAFGRELTIDELRREAGATT